MTYHICLETCEHEVYEVLKWIDAEWAYVVSKFGRVSTDMWDQLPETEFVHEWTRHINSYYDRAHVFGLDDIRGRQALAKAAQTALAFAAASARRYGDLPIGGTPSGTATPQ